MRRRSAPSSPSLQDSLRGIDLTLPTGDAMAPAYFAQTIEACRKHDGTILVAYDGGNVIGFATVLARVPFESADSPPGDFAYLMDLVVNESYRQGGIGGDLLAAAEEVARAAGATEFRTPVLHGNRAINLYRRAGMADYSITLRKRLVAGAE